MNYLAHFYLAKESEVLIVGNFIADFVKGNKLNNYDPEIAKGIQMHRDIDTFTDSHPVVYETKKRLFNDYHKYSGVIVDIYYDYILADSWSDYEEIELKTFSANIYRILYKYLEQMPDKAQYVLQYMSSGDWLGNYSTINGITSTLKGLSRRTKYKSGMEHAANELKRDLPLIRKEFNLFFPELKAFFEHYNR